MKGQLIPFHASTQCDWGGRVNGECEVHASTHRCSLMLIGLSSIPWGTAGYSKLDQPTWPGASVYPLSRDDFHNFRPQSGISGLSMSIGTAPSINCSNFRLYGVEMEDGPLQPLVLAAIVESSCSPDKDFTVTFSEGKREAPGPETLRVGLSMTPPPPSLRSLPVVTGRFE